MYKPTTLKLTVQYANRPLKNIFQTVINGLTVGLRKAYQDVKADGQYLARMSVHSAAGKFG